MVQLLGRDVPIREKIEYVYKAETITYSGIQAVVVAWDRWRAGANKDYHENKTSRYVSAFPQASWDWRWVVQKGEYTGKLPKRVAAYAHKTYNLDIPADVLEKLGNEVRPHAALSESTVVFDITDQFDWIDGDFGDSGSCYWNDREHAKAILLHNGAMAVRFYDPRNKSEGIGRCWLVPQSDKVFAIYNGYGQILNGSSYLVSMAKILAAYFGDANYAKGEIDFTSGKLWVNDSCYLIGTEIPEERSIYMEWDDDVLCHHCKNSWTNDGDSYYDDSGFAYCRKCRGHATRDAHRCRCNSCGNRYDDDDIMNGPDGEGYCHDCFYEHFTTCDHCSEDYDRDSMTYISHLGIDVCEGCLEDTYVLCDVCDRYESRNHAHEDVHDFPRNTINVCDKCWKQGDYAECDECSEEFHIDHMTHEDGVTLCEDCLLELKDRRRELTERELAEKRADLGIEQLELPIGEGEND
jgi:hypothetical protein